MEAVTGRRIWYLFFILSFGVVLWFLVQFGIKIFFYLGLSHKTEAVMEGFFVKELPGEKYAIKADYHYRVHGEVYHKSDVFTAPIFPNRLAAEYHLQKYWKTKQWSVWYSDRNPMKASLQKLFPFKLFFNTCLSLGVLFYFVWLRHYVSRRY